MQSGRTITRRKITALGWFDDGKRKTTGLIKVEIHYETKPGVKDPRYLETTHYFVGTIIKTEDAFKDARTIIDTGKEITQKQAQEMMEKRNARN